MPLLTFKPCPCVSKRQSWTSPDSSCKSCGGWGQQALIDGAEVSPPTTAEFSKPVQGMLNSLLPKRRLSWGRRRA